MIDLDDIGDAGIIGMFFPFLGVILLVIFLVLYFKYSVPEIDACHEKGGVIVRIESEDVCVKAPEIIK